MSSKSDNNAIESFSDRLYKSLRPLIELMTNLHDVGLEKLNIELPRIAVVGEQSTGKSSVLESIVGEDFLPKSEELCTRRPLYLRLMRKEGPGFSIRIKNAEKAEFQTVKTFEELQEKIGLMTIENAGNKGKIIPEPIYVDIEKPDCPELTLIDLPGITKNPLVDSDQGEDIEEITKGLIKTFIEKKQTIILCVIPGNVDIATVDSIKLAKEYDPTGIRTVGVVTKADIMDKGTNLRKVLEQQYVKLNLGFVAVKNRSKKDIQDGMTIQQARMEEKKFFETHEIYSKMKPELFGTESLSKRLMTVMQKRIEEELPSIKNQVLEKLKKAEEDLRSLGEEPPSTPSEMQKYVGDIIADFLADFGDRLEGNQLDNSNDYYGPGYLYHKFFQFAKQMEEECTLDLDSDKLKRLLLNSSPLTGFGSFKAFKMLVEENIKKFREPSLELVDDISEHVTKLGVHSIAALHADNFENLLHQIQQISNQCIEDVKDEIKKLIQEYISCLEYVFTASADYEELAKPEPKASDGKAIASLSMSSLSSPSKKTFKNRIMNVSASSEEEMRASLNSYLKKKREIVEDTVAQIIGKKFADRKAFISLLRSKLDEMRSNVDLKELVAEPEKIELERNRLKQEKDVLSKSKKVLEKFSLLPKH